MDVKIRRLTAQDDRSQLQCNDPRIDRSFREYVAVNEFRYHACATYVAVVDQNIRGFATVVAASVEARALGRIRGGLPAYPQPVLHLAQLGTDYRAQGQGVGGELMFQVFDSAAIMAFHYGCIGVMVDATPAAQGYYHRFGFVDLIQLAAGKDTIRMFLPLSKIPGTR
jgi:predicted N-acetyltransferase YhbS